jgi:outer membrane protein OmpA-like peptidoglycan-associated protein
MNRVLLSLGIGAFAFALGWSQPAFACGFKAGGAIGAVRYDQLNRTSNPVNIVMFSNPGSEDAEKVLSPKLEIVLSKVGHAVKRVTTKEELSSVLEAGTWPCESHGAHDVQVVLADLPDAETIGARNYAVVPIVSKPAEFDREKRTRYPVVLSDSSRPSSHVPMIEAVAKNVAKKSPGVMVASHAPKEERTLTGAREERQAVAAADGREPIATGGSDQVNRGSAVGSGSGGGQRDAIAAAQTTEIPQPAPVAEKKVEPVVVKTEPVAPPVREEKPEVVNTGRSAPEIAATIEEKPPVEKEPPPAPAEKVVEKKKRPQPGRDELYFNTGSSAVTARFGRALMKHVRYLKENTDKSVTIEGHADRSGSVDSNQALSERRADAVKNFLVNKGVNSDRIRTVGYGEEKPVDPPGDSARNRCAVVTYEE